MKYFRNFLQFKNLLPLSEQAVPKQAPAKGATPSAQDEVIGGKTEFEKKVSNAGKKKLRLSYTEKATDPIWQGENYAEVWKPAVDGAMDDPETYQKVLGYLKNYKGQDYDIVQKILQKEEDAEKKGTGNLKFAIKKLATDGKIGPFHTIMRKAVERATGEKIEPLEIKKATFKADLKPDEQPKVKEIPKEKEEKKRVILPPEEDDTPKITGSRDLSITSDPSVKGQLGEEEKQELKRQATGGDAYEKLMSLVYPTFKSPNSSLGKLVLSGGGSVKGKKTTLKIELTKPKGFGGPMHIYIYRSSEPAKKKWSMLYQSIPSNQNELVIPLTTPKGDKFTYKAVISTKKFDFDVRDQLTGELAAKKRIQIFEAGDAVDFYNELNKNIKPFDKQSYDGPVFSISALEVKPSEGGQQSITQLSKEEQRQIKLQTDGKTPMERLMNAEFRDQLDGNDGFKNRLITRLAFMKENKSGVDELLRKREALKKKDKYQLVITLAQRANVYIVSNMKNDANPVTLMEAGEIGPGEFKFPGDKANLIFEDDSENKNEEVTLMVVASLDPLDITTQAKGVLSEENQKELYDLLETTIQPYAKTKDKPNISILKIIRKLVD